MTALLVALALFAGQVHRVAGCPTLKHPRPGYGITCGWVFIPDPPPCGELTGFCPVRPTLIEV